MSRDWTALYSSERTPRSPSVGVVAAIVAATLLLLLPAMWNGFPLLQWDTGGYIARWYEGTLVESRSTVYAILPYLFQTPDFWPAIVVQSVLTAWVISVVLRVNELTRPAHLVVAVCALVALTSLPWLTSILLTDIFAGLAVLTFYLLVFEGEKIGTVERYALFVLLVIATATHGATMLMMAGMVVASALLAWWVPGYARLRQLALVAVSPVLAAALLIGCNYAVSGRVAWTPGGASILFARMMEDGIVKRYLHDHCPDSKLRLCRYRDSLPATADQFLWDDDSIFNKLGRFKGLGNEMETIALQSLVDYPLAQVETAIRAMVRQLVTVRNGEGVVSVLPHTHGIIRDRTPQWVPSMMAARQQQGDIQLFNYIDWFQVPIALGSALFLLVIALRALRRGNFTPSEQMAMVIVLALLGNAAVCGIISNPHPRYGARIAWLAPMLVMILTMKAFWVSAQEPQDGLEEDSEPAESRAGA